MAEQIVDIMEAVMPGPMGDVTPEAVDARDRAERAAERAEAFAGQSEALQDAAVAALASDPDSETSGAVVLAVTRHNPLSYGADPTGASDSSAAFKEACSLADSNFVDGVVGVVHVTAGRYLIADTVRIPPTVKLTFDPGCSVVVGCEVAFDLGYTRDAPDLDKEWFLAGTWVDGHGCQASGDGVDDGRTLFSVGSSVAGDDRNVSRTCVSGFVVHDIQTVARVWANDTYILTFRDFYVEPAGTFLDYASVEGGANSGERMTVEDCTIAGCRRVLSGDSGDFRFHSCSIDYNSVVCQGKATARFIDCHLEGNGVYAGATPFQGCSNLHFMACSFYEAFQMHEYIDADGCETEFLCCSFTNIAQIQDADTTPRVTYPARTGRPVVMRGCVASTRDDLYGTGVPLSRESNGCGIIGLIEADGGITDIAGLVSSGRYYGYSLETTEDRFTLSRRSGKLVVISNGLQNLVFDVHVANPGGLAIVCALTGQVSGTIGNATIGVRASHLCLSGTVSRFYEYGDLDVSYTLPNAGNLSLLHTFPVPAGSDHLYVQVGLAFDGVLTIDEIFTKVI